MQIRCKKAPYDFAWTNPQRRFIFPDKEWRSIDDYGLSVLKKRLKNKFDSFFDTRNQEESLNKGKRK